MSAQILHFFANRTTHAHVGHRNTLFLLLFVFLNVKVVLTEIVDDGDV